MSRKKVTKLKTKKMAFSPLTVNLENAVRNSPGKLVAQLGKEILALTKQEKKLKNAVKKHQAKQKTIQSKHHTLMMKMKNKPSSVSKPKLNANKKALQHIDQAIIDLTDQLEQINKHTTLLTQKKVKFTALSKEISILERQLDKNPITVAPSKTKSKSQKKILSKSKTTDKPTVKPATVEEEPMVVDAFVETVEFDS